MVGEYRENARSPTKFSVEVQTCYKRRPADTNYAYDYSSRGGEILLRASSFDDPPHC